MTYDFQTIVPRRGSDCYKWDSDHAKDCLPLWVADMDFRVAPAIQSALQRRLDHGIFGYTHVPDRYYEAVIHWFAHRHGWTIERPHILYTTGVVPAISAILLAMQRRLHPDGQALRVLTMTPAYNCFFSSIRNIGCQEIDTALVPDENGHYGINWDDFAEKCARADVFLLCNPHNPTGRVWTHEELTRIARICHEQHVFVLSDEIHCEFTFPGEHYTPFALVSQDTYYCTCVSASKAFNVAGLQCANIIIPDAALYEAIDRAVNIHEICDINPFGMEATIAAYTEAEDWLDQLQAHLHANYLFLQTYLAQHMPQAIVTPMEGTYLAWVNIRAYGLTDEHFCEQLASECHVLFNPSSMYGASGYIRINMACPSATLEEALRRMAEWVKK